MSMIDTTETIVGPGTELKRLLRRFFIKDNGVCGCDQKALLMDEQGPDWCSENVETIVRWLQEAAESRGLPFSRVLGKKLVQLAIWKARRKLKHLQRSE